MPWIEPLTRRAAWITIAAVVVVFLATASHFVIPLAMSILLAFLLSPLVRRLGKLFHSRLLAVIVTCTFAFAVLTAGSLVVIYQHADFANEQPKYRHTIAQKNVSLRDASRGPFSRFTGALSDIKHDVEATTTQVSDAAADLPTPIVRVIDGSEDSTTALASLAAAGALVVPFVEPAAMFAVVCVLVVFLLIYSEDIRDRVMVLAGAQQMSITTQALEDAAKRIGHYLLMQAIVNSFFGGAVAIGLMVIGVPNGFLLGLLAGVLRFIPVVGVWIGALLPLLLSVAVFDRWTPVVEVAALYLVLEAITNFAVEPRLYGSGTGLSGMAVLVCIMFWTWIWGPIGLLLAVPITVCLVVMGKYVEPMRAFYIVLGDEPVLDGERRLYHRLMTGDFSAAETIVHQATADIGEPRVCDEYLLPVLHTARADHARGALSDERYRFICDSITGLGTEIVDVKANGGTIACAGVEDSDRPAATLVCMAISNATGEVVSSLTSVMTGEIVARVKEDGIATLVLVCTSPESLGRARLLNKALRTRLSGVNIYIADLSGNAMDIPEGMAAGDPTLMQSVGIVIERIQQMHRSQLNVTGRAPQTSPSAA